MGVHINNQPADLTKAVEKAASEAKEKPITKMENMLRAMLERGALTAIDGFELNPIDTCLNTTVSDLKKSHGIELERRQNKAANEDGIVKPFKWYWIGEHDLERVKKLLERWAKARGVTSPTERQNG